MKFKMQVTFGLILLITGIAFDFLFVQWKVSTEVLRANPIGLNSWEKELYNLTKFYMITLGLTNIVLALLQKRQGRTTTRAIIGFYLMTFGSSLLIGSGLWYASAGPSYEWELRCTVLTIGLTAVFISLGLELFNIVFEGD